MPALPSGLLLFDTGIYIRSARQESYLWLRQDERLFQRTVMTAVVAAELYAGTQDQHEKRKLDELCRAHWALGHFSVPTDADWLETGMLLRRARRIFGQMLFPAHFRDLLIAVAAMAAQATLVTENVRDFARWKSVLASTGRTLRIFNPAS